MVAEVVLFLQIDNDFDSSNQNKRVMDVLVLGINM